MPSLASRFALRARRRAGSVAIEVFFHGLSRVVRAASRVDPGDWGLRVSADVPYLGTGRAAHRLDVWSGYAPGANAPVVFYVHGGGFRILSKDTHRNFAFAFARLGYVVVSVNYTLSRERPFPAALEDVVSAWTWTLDNVARFGGDPATVVVAGESAGGNLVTALTILCTMQRSEAYAQEPFARGTVPVATMPACPLLQVSNPGRFDAYEPPLSAFTRDRVWEVCEGYLGEEDAPARRDAELADPICILEGNAEPTRPLPPFFALCGTHDFLIDDARRLARALERRNVPCEHPEYPREVHAFHALPMRRQARNAWREQRAFLAGALGLRTPRPFKRLRT